MLGLPGHQGEVTLEDVILLVEGGQLRPTDLIRRRGEPWRAANEIPELMDRFEAPPAAKPPAARPSRGITTRNVPKVDPGPARTRRRTARATTRIPTESRPPAEAARPEPAKKTSEETRPAEETRHEPETKRSSETRPASETRPPAVPSRPVPRPAPRPVLRLEPMTGKYYSPVDLLRSASFAFEPRKLLVAAGLTTPLAVASMLAWHLAGEAGAAAGRVLWIGGWMLVALGGAFVLVTLAYLTRRQLEGAESPVGEVVAYAGSHLMTALVYPVLVMIPSLLCVGILRILALVRNMSGTGSAVLKIAYLFPMAFAFVAVLGALLYQLASMYVPAAAAIEGQGLTGAVNSAWVLMRRQWGRVVMHWLIVTVAVSVIGAVCLGLAHLAVILPDAVFGEPAVGTAVETNWNGFDGLFALYAGLAYGLGASLPMSLFSTLGTLSYMSLRHPVSEQLSPMEETSGIPLAGPRATTTPPEATHPAETRPAPADYSGEDSRPPEAAATDVSEDSPE